jgi:hypothetical protein
MSFDLSILNPDGPDGVGCTPTVTTDLTQDLEDTLVEVAAV